MEFSNKVAIVTGTTGIGKAIAKRFDRGGAQVLSCGIDLAALRMKGWQARPKLTVRAWKCEQLTCLAVIKFKQQLLEQ